MAQTRPNFDPATGDDTTGALRKLDNNCVDLDTRINANAALALPKAGGAITGNLSVAGTTSLSGAVTMGGTGTAVTLVGSANVVGGSGLHVGTSSSLGTQGCHMAWNSLASGSFDFVCNQGLGAGGFRFRTVNSTNSAVVGDFGFSGGGQWAGGSFYNQNDNAGNLGSGSQRWAAVFAITGTIQTSDARTKTEVRDTELGLSFISRLRPVSYRLIEGMRNIERVVTGQTTDVQSVPQVDAEGNPVLDASGVQCFEEVTTVYDVYEDRITTTPGVRRHHGMLAQEVHAALLAENMQPGDCSLWTQDDPANPGSRQGLRYEEFVAPLIKAVQEQQDLITALSKRIATLEAGAA